MGEGDAEGADGVVRPAAELLAEHGIEPVELREKEGLALLNGTDGMLGMLVMACADLARLFTSADITAALCRWRRCSAPTRCSRPSCTPSARTRARPPRAANMRRCWPVRSSPVTTRTTRPRVQDAYSIRCAPQVAGAGRDTLAHARLVADRELASAVDNPVVLPDGRVESNGNFHGAPGGLRARLPRHRRRRPRVDRRAAHRPAARQEPFARAAAVPGRTTPVSTPG